MKIRFLRCVVLAAALLAGAAYGGNVQPSHHDNQIKYRVTNLISLGGTVSAGNSINDDWAAGFSNLEGDATTHAALWRHSSPFDLGTLGGPNSNVAWPVKNNREILAGIAETADTDPFLENWSCSAFFPGDPTHHTCLGFVWKDGEMNPLPTLGGGNGFATGVNKFGQVVGWAENTVHDTTCVLPQVLQFRAVIWGPHHGQIQELPPLAGDTVSSATAINDAGQVVGISGICDRAVGRFSAIHPVLWENGAVTNLGTLGGDAWNTAMAINKKGDVVGFSNVTPGRPISFQAFLWTRDGGMKNLGALPGDVISEALGINKRGQVVGMSCTAGFASCRAFLWEDDVMTDLNSVLKSGYTNQLIFAGDITDDGVITGQAFDPGTNESLAFRATPTHDDHHFGSSVEQDVNRSTQKTILPESVRKMILQRSGANMDDLTQQ